MIYRELAPHPKLRKHIKCFWMLDHDYSRSAHDHEQLWADAHTELIFTSGRRYLRKTATRLAPLPASFVVGPFQNELTLHSRGRTALVAARFWPWGFHAFSKVPMADLKNTVRGCRVTLDNARALEDELSAIETAEAKIAALERAMLQRIATLTNQELLARPLAMDILEAHGTIRVTELQRKHGIPPRRMERTFLEEIGVTAKVFARIVRFNHAKKAIEMNPDVDLTKLAHECGYFDQPHFTRNFREMFGITPSEFKAVMKGAPRFFETERPDVAFLQD